MNSRHETYLYALEIFVFLLDFEHGHEILQHQRNSRASSITTFTYVSCLLCLCFCFFYTSVWMPLFCLFSLHCYHTQNQGGSRVDSVHSILSQPCVPYAAASHEQLLPQGSLVLPAAGHTLRLQSAAGVPPGYSLRGLHQHADPRQMEGPHWNWGLHSVHLEPSRLRLPGKMTKPTISAPATDEVHN